MNIQDCCLCQKDDNIVIPINKCSIIQCCRCKTLLHLKSEEDNNLSPLQKLVNKSHKCPSCNNCSECKESFTLEDENIQHCDRCEALFYHGGCDHKCPENENTMRCLQWNVCQLNDLKKIKMSRVNILRDLLRNNDIDIVFLQDLGKGFQKIHGDNKRIFKNYYIIPEDDSYSVHFLIRKTPEIEILDIIKPDCPVNEEERLADPEKYENQVLRIKIRWNGHEIFLTNFYCRHRTKVEKKNINDFFNTQFLPAEEYGIVAGDFNANSALWNEDCDDTSGKKEPRERGKELVKWMNANRYTCVNDKTEKTFRKQYSKAQLTSPNITFFNNRMFEDIDFHQDSTNWRVIPQRQAHYAIKFNIVSIRNSRKQLEDKISSKGWNLLKTDPNGSCQFDSVAKSCGQFFLRKEVVEYLKTLCPNIYDENPNTYSRRMSDIHELGDKFLLQAMAEILKKDICVITPQLDTDIHIFPIGSERRDDDSETISIARISKLHYFGVEKNQKLVKKTDQMNLPDLSQSNETSDKSTEYNDTGTEIKSVQNNESEMRV